MPTSVLFLFAFSTVEKALSEAASLRNGFLVTCSPLLGGCLLEERLRIQKSKPEVEQGYPLNLSILLGGGKETN
jgi:hypothetical protein